MRFSTFLSLVGTTFFILFNAGYVWGQNEYIRKYLYTEPNPDDPGGLRILIPAPPYLIRCGVAIARHHKNVYKGTIEIKEDQTKIEFLHLPADRYDLLFVCLNGFYEGIYLTLIDPSLNTPQNHTDIASEIQKIEAFFDHKEIIRTQINENREAVVLLQQWRKGKTYAESGRVLEGIIHSIDLLFFQAPGPSWQLTKRRQLYREETHHPDKLRHLYLKELSGFIVTDTILEKTISLPSFPSETSLQSTK